MWTLAMLILSSVCLFIFVAYYRTKNIEREDEMDTINLNAFFAAAVRKLSI
jgi:preprotein translocase subunit SecY